MIKIEQKFKLNIILRAIDELFAINLLVLSCLFIYPPSFSSLDTM